MPRMHKACEAGTATEAFGALQAALDKESKGLTWRADNCRKY